MNSLSFAFVYAGKPYWMGRISTVDLLVITNSNHILLVLIIILCFSTKQVTLTRRSIVLDRPLKYLRYFYFLFFNKTSYLNKEVNRIEPSPLVEVPVSIILTNKKCQKGFPFSGNEHVSLFPQIFLPNSRHISHHNFFLHFSSFQITHHSKWHPLDLLSKPGACTIKKITAVIYGFM
jgi:hypothetical protein